MPLAILMGILRAISGAIELTAALLMIYFNDVATSLKINSLLAIIGPSIMILVTTLGLIGISNQVSPWKMLTILLGVILIFYSLNKL